MTDEMDKMFSKIISGGQTGVDRAALDVALELGIPCGGWCPKGRKAEDGIIDPKYSLREMPSPKYPVRTEKNVREADGTLILTQGPVTGGTALTLKLAKKHKKPLFLVDFSSEEDPQEVINWGRIHDISILNVAGPRESKVLGIHDRTVEFLKRVFLIKFNIMKSNCLVN